MLLHLGQFQSTWEAVFGMQPYYIPTRRNMEDDLTTLENGTLLGCANPPLGLDIISASI
jgi:hypothetical protein